MSDLDRSMRFYSEVVGLSLALHLPERDAAFFWIGAPGRAMLGLWSIGSSPNGLALHIAFAASLEDVLGACDGLRASGVTPLSFFGVEASEPSVIAWMPAAAVYFRDPDGHMIEYLAMLDDPPQPDAGILQWSQWEGRSAHAAGVQIVRHTGAREQLRGLFEEADDSAAAIDAYMNAGDVLVALVGDRIAGHLQLITAAGDQGEIKNMAVEAAYRGRGIGRKLVRAAVDLARAQRCARLVVAAAAAGTGTLRFYQRCGFRMRSLDRDAFTPAAGYAPGTIIDGIELRDRVWLELSLVAGHG